LWDGCHSRQVLLATDTIPRDTIPKITIPKVTIPKISAEHLTM